jgi:hypothetical protein
MSATSVALSESRLGRLLSSRVLKRPLFCALLSGSRPPNLYGVFPSAAIHADFDQINPGFIDANRVLWGNDRPCVFGEVSSDVISIGSAQHDVQVFDSALGDGVDAIAASRFSHV